MMLVLYSFIKKIWKRDACCCLMFTFHYHPAFPAENRTIAGVFQVTYLNDDNIPQYALNASEARNLCAFLGLTIASKAQVKEALARGLETCR